MMPVEAAAAEDWSACAFSLTCEEDGADLGDGSVDDGELFSPYNARDEEEEEYLELLVFKEASFCCSSDSAADCDGDGDGDVDGTTSSSSPRSGSGKLASPPSSGFLK